MIKRTKCALIALLVLAALPALSYAGGQKQESAAPGGFKFTMMANFNQPEPPRESSDLMQFIRNTLKADIQFNWTPTAAYNDKLGVQLATLDLADVTVARGNTRDASVVSAIRDGAFWPLDKYLNNPKYPGLAKLSAERLAHIRLDGHVWGLPIERDLSQAGVLYRKDWLDKLGIPEPKNMNDVWEIMKAFTERDPDGNGKADTTGLSMKGRNLSDKLSDVAVYYGGRQEWYYDEASRTVKHETEDPAYQKSLDFHRDAYAKGYFVSNVVELNNEYLPLQQGRAGLVFFSDINDVVDTQLKVAAVFPEARIGFTQNLAAPDGKIAMRSHIGYNGAFLFSKSSIKTEERLEEIIKFFDLLGSDENILTMRRGIKDKHYTIVNGQLVATEAQIKAFRETDFPDASLITPFGVTKPIPEKMSDPLTQATADSVDNYKGLRYIRLSDIYVSDTAVKLGNNLTDILRDARMKYVLGEINLAGWNAEVARWRAAGGDNVKAELTAAYLANPQ
ncbi:putative ABC transporter peptide-binding protein YtcQ [Spirochaetia bacterium]|nr:putative ABC transporter peptide-binding protein YtcQ [Spirochaetia bacterium]